MNGVGGRITFVIFNSIVAFFTSSFVRRFDFASVKRYVEDNHLIPPTCGQGIESTTSVLFYGRNVEQVTKYLYIDEETIKLCVYETNMLSKHKSRFGDVRLLTFCI